MIYHTFFCMNGYFEPKTLKHVDIHNIHYSIEKHRFAMVARSVVIHCHYGPFFPSTSTVTIRTLYRYTTTCTRWCFQMSSCSFFISMKIYITIICYESVVSQIILSWAYQLTHITQVFLDFFTPKNPKDPPIPVTRYASPQAGWGRNVVLGFFNRWSLE